MMASASKLPGWALQRLPSPDHLTAWAVGVLGLDGRILYLNPGMRALLSDTANAAPRIEALVNPTFADLAGRALAAADGSLVFEGFLTAGDGYRNSQSLRAQVWRCDQSLLISAEHDVSELDRLNRALTETNRQVNRLQHELLKKNRLLEAALHKLTQAQTMLVHSEKMNALGQLVAGVAHEINNPLGFTVSNLHSLGESIATLTEAYGNLERLAREGDPGAAAIAVPEIRTAHDLDFILEDLPPLLAGTSRGLERIGKIVQQLRTFSRLDEAELKTVDLAQAIREVVELAGASLREGGVNVTIDLADLPPIACYASELNQVFMNLVVNAAQAMTAGGTLAITGRRLEPDTIELQFADTGCGIPPESLGRIFDPFFTTKPVGAGTGLGLSLAYQIVTERHGGRISVQSTPGVGSTFTLILPRAVAAERAQ